MKFTVIALILFALWGCESGTLYQWGGYEDKLYVYYKKPQERGVVISNMEAHVASLEANSKIVPPGMYAEIGTFYLELGDELKALDFYKKEAQAWPESSHLMKVLISNLEARQVKTEASDAS